MSAENDYEIRLKAARDLYEGTHGMTMVQLSEITGIHQRTLKMASRDEEWRKKLETKTGATTAEALAAAELFRKMLENGTETLPAELPTAEANQAVELVGEAMPTEREALLERHKKEWSVPRALSVEAVRLRDSNPMRAFEKAKMAKITAECLKIVQDGERRAHGIDKGDGDHTIVLERG